MARGRPGRWPDTECASVHRRRGDDEASQISAAHKTLLAWLLDLAVRLVLSGGSGHIVLRMVDDDTGQEVQLAWLGV